jgi:hypothetical protein
LERIFEVVDFSTLPAETQPIAQMLVDGLTQTEIATTTGRSEEAVSRLVRLLRDALIEQALERADTLGEELRDHLLALRRGSTARGAGGGTSRQRRTGSTRGISRTSA